jgi:transcriptional antiterminator RfaH
MKCWYAVQSKPRQEDTAEQNLQHQGFQTYLPKISVRKLRRDKWTKAVEPLFPRYLFIQVDAQQTSLAPVRSTQGVAALVRFGQLLRPLPDSVINYLKQTENPDTHRHDADEWLYQPGDNVEFLGGAFAGLKGIFKAVSADERAMVLIDLLGRQNTIGVNMDSIAKVV